MKNLRDYIEIKEAMSAENATSFKLMTNYIDSFKNKKLGLKKALELVDEWYKKTISGSGITIHQKRNEIGALYIPLELYVKGDGSFGDFYNKTIEEIKKRTVKIK